MISRGSEDVNYLIICQENHYDNLNHDRIPRGGQLDEGNGREIILKTGERAPGIILLTNLFHGSFECLSVIVFCAQSEAIIYPATFVIL